MAPRPALKETRVLLNRVEKAMMNNPLREAAQRYFEAPRLLEMGGPLHGGVALEVGCGRGLGTELLLDLFGAGRVDAFDLDPRMVDLAQRRLQGRGDRVRVWVGDVTRIPAADRTYDAVFDFGILHHVPDWRGALAEVFRVLRPGGRFYAEEVMRSFLFHPLWRRILEHPLDDRFDHAGFSKALGEAGFEVKSSRPLGTWFGWFVAERPPTLSLSKHSPR